MFAHGKKEKKVRGGSGGDGRIYSVGNDLGGNYVL